MSFNLYPEVLNLISNFVKNSNFKCYNKKYKEKHKYYVFLYYVYYKFAYMQI